jgi:FtsZ-binding cell division protein ZapB
VHAIHLLHAEVDALKKENNDLYQQIENMQGSLLSHNKSVEEQHAEREELKHTVHDLVKNIDAMMHETGQQNQVHERSE